MSYKEFDLVPTNNPTTIISQTKAPTIKPYLTSYDFLPALAITGLEPLTTKHPTITFPIYIIICLLYKHIIYKLFFSGGK